MQPDVAARIPERGVSRLRMVALGSAAAVAVAGLSWLNTPGQPGAAAALPGPKISSRYAGWDQARSLAETNKTIGDLKSRLSTSLGDMIDQEQLSIAYISRSKLTGDFADLLSARKAADAGIAMSPPGTGPWLAKAAAEFSGHRIAEAANALDVVDGYVIANNMTRGEARAMRSDIAMARGDYAGAERLLGEAETIDEWPGLFFRKALLARVRGDFDGARTFFTHADKMNRDPTPLFRADMELRQGELDYAQGRWPGAEVHYRAALQSLPGYWRAEMRVAQMDAIAGKTRAALSVFERIAVTLSNPDAMYAAAGLNRDLGDEARAKSWISKADAEWSKRLAQMPEAGWGHALEHELAFGDPKRALSLAQKNAANRPYAIPLLLLAEAWIANGRPELALILCEKVKQSGWVSADQWTIRALALDKLGRTADAKDARAEALKINPREGDTNPALKWFHD